MYKRQTLSRVVGEDEIWIPYAVEVDSQIITLYDPAIHRRMEGAEPGNRDERWVLCQRPAILVGGELTAEMLDLQFNPVTKFYVAPAQMKANNGVLIIDDFGRPVSYTHLDVYKRQIHHRSVEASHTPDAKWRASRGTNAG